MEEPEKIVSQTELDDKAQKLVEEKDADSRLRVYVGPMEKALTAVLLIWAVFQVWANMFGTLGAVKLRTAHIMFLLPLAFTLYPTFKKERRRRRLMPVWDIALIAAAILSYGYLFMRYDAIARTGRLNSTDVWVGVVCLVVAFEAARRASGNLAIIALIFLSYFAVWGRYIPGTFGTSAFTLKRVIKALVWDTNGVLGTGAGVSATYIFVFVLFGAFLKYSGFSQFINDIALTLVGQTPGGPAKVAVIASALMGMINGSAIANVATTGTITIPLMKKTGYKKDFAAAVEATASTGGAIMPPIMGSTAFIMAEMLGIPYTAVAKAALIPAILYFLAVLFGVDIYAAKHGLKGIPRSQLPKVRSMLKQIYMLAPLIFLIFCMAVFNMTIVRSGLLTIIVTLVLVEINPKTRMTKEQWLQIPVQTVKSAVSVGIACAMAGIISGVIMGSGLGYRISSILTSVAGTSMLLLLVLTMVVSLIMGMGVPTTAAYLVLASLVAPTMIQLGIPPLAAHMFIFYFGCISSITPPVALAAYAGAGLAGCDPNKTGYKAFRLAFCSFLMPYLFVYNPVLLMEGGVLDILWSLVTALIGAYLLASGFEGFFFRWSLKWFERPLMILGAVMLIVPGMVTDLVGIAIIVVEFVTEFMFKRSEKFVPVTVSQSTT